MLLNFFMVFCLFLIRFFIELRILDMVATTKFSSYVDIFLALANRFRDI